MALAINALPVTASPEPLASVLTSVVSSAALHACLLHDAEQLRATHPGLERFKMAAQKNVQRWWNGTLKLKGNVRVYSPAEQGWVSTSGASETTTVEGPFAYLVTALVSRFEHSFIVAPFRNAMHHLAPHAGENPSVDVVCVRPQRHGRTRRLVQTGREQEAREDWIQRVWDVMGGDVRRRQTRRFDLHGGRVCRRGRLCAHRRSRRSLPMRATGVASGQYYSPFLSACASCRAICRLLTRFSATGNRLALRRTT